MMRFEPEPLTVTCDTCGASAETWDYQHPDRAVECGCCPVAHDHGGLGCRTVTITARAHLTMMDVNDLMSALGEVAEDAHVEPADVLFLVHRMAPGA